MQTIGERLEEARKRQGISIREASEATKIRSDFLLSMESNAFDYPLPEVYKRGFLRLYAKYLKLDADKVLADYTAFQLGASRIARREGREHLGRIDMPGRGAAPRPTPGLARKPAEVESAEYAAAPEREEPKKEPAAPAPAPARPAGPDKLLPYKIGAILGGTLLAVILVVVLVVRSGAPKPSEETPANEPAPIVEPSAMAEELVLIGTGDTRVMVFRASDNAKIWEGALTAGSRQVILKSGRVTINVTNGENLQLEYKGKRFRPRNVGTQSFNLD